MTSAVDTSDLDEDTLRIMISTDNHLGYCERDPGARGLDSFAAFEEVLYLSKLHKCDMVLIAGDLFHDNKPSRRTMHKTMEIIRRYCMGPDAVQIQIVSDQATNFRSVHGAVNYEDEYYSVDLPIFSIHGNHDDPTRDSGQEMLAALDLLAVSNLVNYFGRQDEVDNVNVSPVLIEKGDTKIALYGLGSMRDERLNRMWSGQKVKFLQPDEGEWFHIFALHQNRDLGRGVKNCVHESMIPEWMDLVVWGHEHECLIEPAESVVGTFRITQPGSSVATSLTTGEAVRKHVGILDVKYNQFRLRSIPLTQVRSFVMGDISLAQHDDLDADDPKIDAKVSKVLEEEVKVLIHDAKEKHEELLEAAKAMGNYANEEPSVKYKLEKPEEVLVRLKVEHTGFTTLNNQRFGAKFVGKVANPDDVLLFHRRKETASRATPGSKKASSFGMPVPPEEIDEIVVDDLIKENLEEAALEIFNEKGLGQALEAFVDKEETKAINEAMEKMLKKQVKVLIERGEDEDEEDADDVDDEQVAESGSQKSQASSQTSSKKRKKTEVSPEEDGDEEEDTSPENKPNKRRSKTKPTSKASRNAASRRASFGDSSEEDEDMEESSARKKSTKSSAASRRPKRQAARGRVTYSVDDDSDDASEESDAVIVMDQDDDDDDIEVVTKKSSRGASSKKGKGPTCTKATSRSKKRKTVYASDSEDASDGYGVDDDWGSQKTNTEA